MNILNKIKEKSVGYYLIFAASVIALVAAILYLAFGIASHTFVGWIFVCLLIDVALGIGLFFYEGYFSDYIIILIVAMLTLAFGLLIMDSVGDITEFVTGVGMYGDRNNVTMRVVIAVFMFLGIVTAIIGGFLKRTKNPA